jgi:hypothetical protein
MLETTLLIYRTDPIDPPLLMSIQYCPFPLPTLLLYC